MSTQYNAHGGPERQTDRVPVLVVGGGPVGLTAAHLLAACGIRTLLVERNTATSDEAKAISLDGESLRSLQLCGLGQAVARIVVPGTGTRYHGAGGQVLFHARGAAPQLFGYAFKNQFAQPEFERVLLKTLAVRDEVESRFGTELTELEEEPDGVTAVLSGPDGVSRVRASYVLACDGGRSTVRKLCGMTMSGRRHDDLWLVADTLQDPHDERFAMHHGDPRRPHVIVPGREGRCRYEFYLHPGEATPGEEPPFELVQRLVSRYRNLEPHHVERAVTYTFNELVATRWRHDRVFLLGDAAHMMPPFAGQGLNSGVRDAANLCWKVAAVLTGQAADGLLDTYERERLPHASAVVGLSVRLGTTVMTTSKAKARLRDGLVWGAMRTGPGRRYLTEMRFRPSPALREGLVIGTARGPNPLLGRPLGQPTVLNPDGWSLGPLDEVLGQGFALLGVDVSEDHWRTVTGRLPQRLPVNRVDVVLGDRMPPYAASRLAVADVDGELERLFAAQRGQFVLLRPDRYVCAVFTAAEAGTTALALDELLGRPDGPASADPGPPSRSGTGPDPRPVVPAAPKGQ